MEQRHKYDEKQTNPQKQPQPGFPPVKVKICSEFSIRVRVRVRFRIRVRVRVRVRVGIGVRVRVAGLQASSTAAVSQ